MEKSKPVIVFAIISLLLFVSIDYHKLAYAVEFADFSGLNNADAVVSTSFVSGSQTIQAFKVMLAGSPLMVNTYNAESGSIISTGTDLTTECERGATAGSCFGRAMDCSGNTCYILASVTIGTARWRLLNANTNTIIANATGTGAPMNAMDCSSTTCFFAYDNAGAEKFVSINLSTGAEATIIADLGLGGYAGSIKLMTISGVTYYTVTGDIINAWFDIYRTDTLTGCSSAGTQTALDAETDGTYFYVALTGGTIDIRNTSCASVGTIASANLCGGTSIQDIEISGTDLYTYCESNNRIAQTDITNPLSTSLLQIVGCSGATPTLGNYQKPIAYNSVGDSIGCSNFTSDTFRMIFLGAPPSGGGGITEFCQLPENENLLRCVLERNGGALGSNQTSNPIAIETSFCGILIQTGFLDGSNLDHKTNGCGYIMLAITLLIVNSLMVITAIGIAHRFDAIPLFMYLIVTLAIMAGFVLAEWTDVTFFIITVVAIIALASPKIIQTIQGIRGGEVV